MSNPYTSFLPFILLQIRDVTNYENTTISQLSLVDDKVDLTKSDGSVINAAQIIPLEFGMVDIELSSELGGLRISHPKL